MGEDFAAIRRQLGNVPWLTKNGLDLARFPIGGVLRQVVHGSEEEVRAGLRVLQAMQQRGRVEAGIFLLGLLSSSEDDWKRREGIVRALEGFEAAGCVRFLCAELRRVKSSNTTRRYLGAIVDVLAGMPLELIEKDLGEMADDARFSPRMRDKFVRALWAAVARKGT